MTQELLDYFNGDELAASVWEKKYALRDKEENIIESSPDDMHKRLAKGFFEIEEKYNKKIDHSKKELLSEYGKNRNITEQDIYEFFKNFKYIIPGGSVMYGLGQSKPVSLSNCFVTDSPKDSMIGIFKTCAEQASLFKRRGGDGYDISTLRPNRAKVNNSAHFSTGSVSFMDLFSQVTKTVGELNRRGALLLSLYISHPDAEEFIEKKQDLTKVTGANISIQVLDEFMKAVIEDKDYIQRFPVDKDIPTDLDINNLSYNKLVEYKANNEIRYFKKIKARDLWNKFIHCSWNTAEPGIMFRDRMINYSPDGVYPKYKMVSTNPCVTADTTLLTPNGFVKIGDVANKEITIWNGWEWCTLTPFKTSDNAEVFLVEFSDGSELKCTSYHKFILSDGSRKELKDLKIGDKLIKWILPSGEEKENIKIKSIEKVGFEATYCVNEEKNHSCLFNSVVTANCGEIGMGKYDSCRLIHINLTSIIKNPFTKDAFIDKNLLYKIAYETLVLGDNLVDLEIKAVEGIIGIINQKDKDEEIHLWEKINQTAKETRRCGAGFTGLADAIAMLGLKYASEESFKYIEDVLKTIFEAQLDATIDLAILRGKFEGYDGYLENKGNDWYSFVEKEFSNQFQRMKKFGRRNISFSTVAPTGTVSLLVGCSSGIEPVFLALYKRNVKCNKKEDRVDFVDINGEKYTTFIVIHPTLKQWCLNNIFQNLTKDEINNLSFEDWNNAFIQSPWYQSTAPDINWRDRVKLQGIIQKYITHSISSTINLPKEITKEEINEIFLEAWKCGNKGQTIYRDGCRDGVLNSIKKEKPQEIILSKAPKRPNELEADYYEIKSKGIRYAILVGLYNNKPYEIFAFELNDNEQSLKQHRGKIIKIGKMHYRFVSDSITIKNLQLKNENVEEKAATLYSSMLLRHGVDIKYIIKTAKKVNENIVSFSSAICRILSKYLNNEELNEKCPECGGRLVREAGCIHCLDCTYSKCM